MKNKKGSLFLIIIRNLVSPFSMLVLFSGIVNLIASYFMGKGYSDGLILFVLYLAFVILHIIVEVKDPQIREKSFYKSYVDLFKIVISLAFFAIAIVVISSLLHQFDVPSIIKGASYPFLIGLPIGFLPLYLFIKEKDEATIDNTFKKCASELLPILVVEFLLTIIFPIMGLGFAFNSNELIIINLVFVFLVYLFDFVETKKDIKTPESQSLGRKVLFRGVLIGFLFTVVVLMIFLIAPMSELLNSNQSINLNNIQHVLRNENDVLSSGQCHMFASLSFGFIIYSYFFFNKPSEILNSKRFIRSLCHIACMAILLGVILIPWVNTFVYSTYMALVNLLYALLSGLSLSLFALIYKLIERKVTNNKKSD